MVQLPFGGGRQERKGVTLAPRAVEALKAALARSPGKCARVLVVGFG
jgi:hypothetical protein